MKNKQHRLGIDIGRVIITPGDDSADTSFLRGSVQDALDTPPYPGAVETIARLVSRFEGRVWLVSKAGPRTQEKTRLWLEYHQFYQRSGVGREQVRFCRQRHEKADHCRELQITHFIDDRIQVLKHLRYLVPNLYLFGDQNSGFMYPEWVVPTLNWPQVRDAIDLT
ncbi:MAG: hypothetical protein PVJ39_17150 [Gammaproteobacteria bacterium]|jgi:hypothetical protein